MKIGQPVQLTVIDLSDDTFGQIKLSCFQNQVNHQTHNDGLFGFFFIFQVFVRKDFLRFLPFTQRPRQLL